MIGVPSVRKWLASSLPLEANSEPWLQSTDIYHAINPNSMYIITRCSFSRDHTAHLTNMILDVTWSSWFRTAWTSMDPIHWRDPTKEACLSPTSTKAWRGEKPLKAASWTFQLSFQNWEGFHIYSTTTIPAGSPCEWAQVVLCSPAAGTRSRWSAGSDKHNPNHCHPCGPACSGDSCRSPGPSTPWEKTNT